MPGSAYWPMGMEMPEVSMPTPRIMTIEAIMRLRLAPKSTLLVTNILRPFEAISPKSRRLTPPMTGDGMERMSAASLGQKPPTTNANPAAYQKTCVE